MSSENVEHKRLYYIDWLRVLVILTIIPFHASLTYLRYGVRRSNFYLRLCIRRQSAYPGKVDRVLQTLGGIRHAVTGCTLFCEYSHADVLLRCKADNKYVQNKNLYHSGNAENYYIEGSNHYSLTDLVRKSPIVCALLGGGYRKSGYDTLEFINQKSLVFFDKYLNQGTVLVVI